MNFPAAKYLIVIPVAASLLIPLTLHALEIQYSQLPIPGFNGFSEPPTFSELFRFLYGMSLMLSGIIIFSSVFISGFQYFASSANPRKRREARNRLAGIVAGITLLFGTFMILQTVNPQLVNLSEQTFLSCGSSCPVIKAPSLINFIPIGFFGTSGTTTTPPQPPGGTPPTTSGTCSVMNSGPCAPSALQSAFGNNANYASMICSAESGGNPRRLNNKCLAAVAGGSANTTGDYSVGLFQLNLYGFCPLDFWHISATECEIRNQNDLIICAARYGVTLSFARDPNGEITDNDTAKQIQQAATIWGRNNKFCGPWTTANAATCALCPDH